jgi:hypothetical protein
MSRKDVKIRKYWPINPVTKVDEDLKSYNRAKAKREWQDEIDEKLSEDKELDNELDQNSTGC